MYRNIIKLSDGTQISSGNTADVSIRSCTVTDCVNSGAELTIGSTCCSCLDAQFITTGKHLGLSAGQLVRLYRGDNSGNTVLAGVFRLEAPAKKSDNVYKVTAYDRVADLDKDLTEWLTGLNGWPYDLITFAGMVCAACGLTLVTTDIPNGSFPVKRFYKAGVTGRRLMEWICEIACRFCKANAAGNIELGWYTDSGVTIRPSGERYYFAGALTYEDFDVAAIDEVQLRLSDSDSGALWPQIVEGTVTYDYLRIRSGPGVGYSEVGQLAQGDVVKVLEQKNVNGAVWGRIDKGWICITGYVSLETVSAQNPYIITGNPILLASVTNELLPYLEVIKSQLAGLPAYKPCKVSLPAGLDIHAGNTVEIVDKHGNTFVSCVMTKVQNGQRDTLECTGSAKRSSSTAMHNQSAGQLAQQAVENQTHEDIFNRLTKNGSIQGIFVEDDKWCANFEFIKVLNMVADLITAGKLKSADGKTYYDLDSGKIVTTSDAGHRIEITNGNIELFDASGNRRIRIAQGSNSYIYMCDNDGNECGGVGVAYGKFQIMAPDASSGGRLLPRPVVWKEVNGEKVLVADTQEVINESNT